MIPSVLAPETEVEDESIELEEPGEGEDEEIDLEKGEKEDEETSEFHNNLAETLPEPFLMETASKYLDFVQKDLQDRAERYERYAEGLKKTGMSSEPVGAPGINGGSDVVYPVLTEAAIDFQSRTISEIFPASGPVKISPSIDATLHSLEKARKKADYLNRQIIHKIPAFKSELEKLLSQLPLAGNCYRKFWWNSRYNRIDVQFLPVDKVVIPFGARSFYDASRMSVIDDLPVGEIRRRIRSGIYRDVIEVSDEDQVSQDYIQRPEQVNDTIEDRNEVEASVGYRTIIEVYADMEIPEDKMAKKEWGTAPYIMTIDATSSEVLAIYRNWAEGDETGRRKDHLVDWALIPWRGAYAVGLTHIAGPLAGYLSGCLRLMLDNAAITTAPMLLTASGPGMTGQNITLQPGTNANVELPFNAKLSDRVMGVPFNPVPQAMFSVFEILDKVTRGIIQTSLDEIGLDNTTVPVGTQMARIEEGMRVYKSIFARMHESMRREIEIMCRLYSEHMEPVYAKDEEGQYLMDAEGKERKVILDSRDFDESADLAPVTDPDVFSEAQRMVRLKMADDIIQQTHAADPTSVDLKAYAKSKLERMNFPNLAQIFPEKSSQANENPAVENVKMCNGALPTVLPDQDHIAHIATHVRFFSSLGEQSPFKTTAMPFMLEHLKQHVLMYYLHLTLEACNRYTGEDVSKWNTRNMDKANELAQIITQVQPMVEQQFAIEIQPLLVSMGALQMEVQKLMTPPAKPTPEELLAQVEMAKDQNRIKVDNAEIQLKAEKQERDMMMRERELALREQDFEMRSAKVISDLSAKAAETQAKNERNTEDNETQILVTMMNKEGQDNNGTQPNPRPNSGF